jgi:hypothetical protein
MIDDIFIYDDSFLDLATVQKIQGDVIYTKPFFYAPIGGALTDGIHGIAGDNFVDYPLWVNSDMDETNPSSVFPTAKFVVGEFAKKHNLKIKEITRSRSNISHPALDRRHTPPHVDNRDDHYVFIYYVNDSDGDTNVYREKYDGTTRTQDDLNLFKAITPKAGLGVLFSGKVFHTWQPPLNTKARCIINMNILLEDKDV